MNAETYTGDSCFHSSEFEVDPPFLPGRQRYV
jgi:hypothetical protein